MILFDWFHQVPPPLLLVDNDYTRRYRDIFGNHLMWAGRSEVLG
jgi:hypothetical protein